MLRCLKRMSKFDSTNGKFHSCLMKFVKLVETETIGDERIRSLIDDELNKFGFQKGNANKQIDESNKKFIEKNSNSLSNRVEGEENFVSMNICFHCFFIDFQRPKSCYC